MSKESIFFGILLAFHEILSSRVVYSMVLISVRCLIRPNLYIELHVVHKWDLRISVWQHGKYFSCKAVITLSVAYTPRT